MKNMIKKFIKPKILSFWPRGRGAIGLLINEFWAGFPYLEKPVIKKWPLLTLKGLFLTVIYGRKHYQIKLNSQFSRSGSLMVKLLNPWAKKTRQTPVGFPQIAAKRNRFYRSDYLTPTGFSHRHLLLCKTILKTIQSGSNNITITANTNKNPVFADNHPCLARTKLLEESNIGQQQNNQRQTESDGHSGVDIKNVGLFNIFHNLNQDAINNETIANTKSLVNIANFFIPFSLEKLGTIKTAPNQPAAKLINKSETTDDQVGLININLVYHTPCN